MARPRDHRKALLKNLCTALVMKESLRTTRLKAKGLQAFVDRAISIAKKKDPMNANRLLKSYVYKQETANKLISELKRRYQDRQSGFTRIYPIKNRVGDNAKLVQIDLIK